MATLLYKSETVSLGRIRQVRYPVSIYSGVNWARSGGGAVAGGWDDIDDTEGSDTATVDLDYLISSTPGAILEVGLTSPKYNYALFINQRLMGTTTGSVQAKAIVTLATTSAVNTCDVQRITLVNNPTGGTFTVTVTDPNSPATATTPALAYNIGNHDFTTALENALISLNPSYVGKITVNSSTPPDGGYKMWTIAFEGFPNQDIPLLTTNDAGLTGGSGYGYIIYYLKPYNENTASYQYVSSNVVQLTSSFAQHNLGGSAISTWFTSQLALEFPPLSELEYKIVFEVGQLPSGGAVQLSNFALMFDCAVQTSSFDCTYDDPMLSSTEDPVTTQVTARPISATLPDGWTGTIDDLSDVHSTYIQSTGSGEATFNFSLHARDDYFTSTKGDNRIPYISSNRYYDSFYYYSDLNLNTVEPIDDPFDSYFVSNLYSLQSDVAPYEAADSLTHSGITLELHGFSIPTVVLGDSGGVPIYTHIPRAKVDYSYTGTATIHTVEIQNYTDGIGDGRYYITCKNTGTGSLDILSLHTDSHSTTVTTARTNTIAAIKNYFANCVGLATSAITVTWDGSNKDKYTITITDATQHPSIAVVPVSLLNTTYWSAPNDTYVNENGVAEFNDNATLTVYGLTVGDTEVPIGRKQFRCINGTMVYSLNFDYDDWTNIVKISKVTLRTPPNFKIYDLKMVGCAKGGETQSNDCDMPAIMAQISSLVKNPTQYCVGDIHNDDPFGSPCKSQYPNYIEDAEFWSGCFSANPDSEDFIDSDGICTVHEGASIYFDFNVPPGIFGNVTAVVVTQTSASMAKYQIDIYEHRTDTDAYGYILGPVKRLTSSPYRKTTASVDYTDTVADKIRVKITLTDMSPFDAFDNSTVSFCIKQIYVKYCKAAKYEAEEPIIDIIEPITPDPFEEVPAAVEPPSGYTRTKLGPITCPPLGVIHPTRTPELITVGGVTVNDLSTSTFIEYIKIDRKSSKFYTPCYKHLFTDSFTGIESELWGNELGDWMAPRGAYYSRLPDISPLAYTSLPFNLTDFVVEFDVYNIKDGGILVRSTDNTDGILIGVGGDSLGFGGSGLFIANMTDSDIRSASLISSAENMFKADGDSHIKVAVSGSQYQVFIDRHTIPILTINETSYTNGKISLVSASKQLYDNVDLKVISEQSDNITPCFNTNTGYKIYRDLISPHDAKNVRTLAANFYTNGCKYRAFTRNYITGVLTEVEYDHKLNSRDSVVFISEEFDTLEDMIHIANYLNSNSNILPDRGII